MCLFLQTDTSTPEVVKHRSRARVAVQALPQLPAAAFPPAAEADPGLTSVSNPLPGEGTDTAPGDLKGQMGIRKDCKEGNCSSTPNVPCPLPF